MKSTTRREKVTADSDPLSLFLSQSNISCDEDAEDDMEEKADITVQQPKSATLINSLAPEKPIEYEPPIPPPREVVKVSSQVQEPAKVVAKKEEILTAPVVVATQQYPPTQPAQTTQPIQVIKQEKKIIKPPPAPASVFEAEDDIFLKKAVKKSADDDIFGAQDGELSELKFISTKDKPISNKLEVYDSDEEEKLDDLAVGGILEREELDFNMFGRSNVKQYDTPQPVNPSKPTLYQDDFTLETEDEFNEMESILNQTQSSKKYSTAIKTSTKTDSSSSIDINSFDINAYISQQESDNNVSLFG